MRRLTALAWLADIAESIVMLLRQWMAVSALAPADQSRLWRIIKRVRRAVRVIAALEQRLREALQSLDAGVRPSPEWVSEGASSPAHNGEPAEIEASEHHEAPDWRERPERPETLSALAPALPHLTGSVDDIIAGVIEDLGAFPAWRRLAEAVWAGEDPAPAEVARILANALIEAMPPRRSRREAEPLTPGVANLFGLAPSPPPCAPAPA
ncbi:MAG: hypothetical protein J0I28_11835 [Caulobacterales bacterium]|nr:hypothetical protein [Caulobacterales bacterium]